MFEFLFKRPGDKSSEQASGADQAAAPPAGAGKAKGNGGAAAPSASASAASAAETAARRAAQAARAKELASDENAAVELILQSEFADVRLAAAAHVQSRPLLERVQQAMRNTDRRVAKLMQSRLDAIRHQQSEQRQAEAAIAVAAKLLDDDKLTPNQVGDLDRQWQVIAAAPELASRFATVRAALAQRLESQVALQRAALDALALVRRVAAGELPAAQEAGHAVASESAAIPVAGDAADAAAPAEAVIVPAAEATATPSALVTLLDRLAADHASHAASPESASLPRHLLRDFDEAMTAARALADAEGQHRAAFDARRAALARWQADDAATLATLNADAARRAWQALPRLPDGSAAAVLQQQFDAFVARLPDAPKPQKAAAAAAPAAAPHAAKNGGKDKNQDNNGKEANQRFMALVDALEAALEHGQLHLASDHDKALRDSRGVRLTPAQSDRLAHVRAELKRLGDWARWGGNVSREELVKAVEELPALKLAMSELAKKVGSMRERWKALDTVSGAAPKSLWERFDAACAAAYAPAAAHFKHLADERHGNAEKAQALIAEARAIADGGPVRHKGKGDAAKNDDAHSAAAAPDAAPDYKGIAAASQRLRQAWTRLGTIDRKDKKKLDAAFGKAMDAMLAPLEAQRRIETACREQLIEEAGKLNPSERHTLDTLRHLQDKWQEHAKALPLERKAEQALWQRFRAACDAVFAARKESAHAADHERRVHLQARVAICEQLEQATFDGDDKAQGAAIAAALRDAAAAWHASGAVPRAAEQKIEQRYKAAVAAVHAQADALKKRAGAAQANALRDKLRLCQALETALAGGAEALAADDWQARWQALPALPSDYEKTLHARLAASLGAADGAPRAAYAATLEANRAVLLQEVLRLEIVSGVDSGAEFARERLKMQVEVLQSSLKSGQKPMTQAAQFLQLCAMPALADARTASRIEQLFRRIGASDARGA